MNFKMQNEWKEERMKGGRGTVFGWVDGCIDGWIDEWTHKCKLVSG